MAGVTIRIEPKYLDVLEQFLKNSLAGIKQVQQGFVMLSESVSTYKEEMYGLEEGDIIKMDVSQNESGCGGDCQCHTD